MDPERQFFNKMEYYSVTKSKEIMKFADKWIQLETIILTEVTQTKKAMQVCTHLQIASMHSLTN